MPVDQVETLAAMPCREHRNRLTRAAIRLADQRAAERERGGAVLHAHPAALRGRLRSEVHAVEAPADGIAGRIRGVASAYDVAIDTVPQRTKLRLGAFAASIAKPEQRRRLRLLWQHDPAQPIGRITSVTDRADVLYFEAEVAATTLGRDVMALVRAGAVREVSVGFDAIDSTFEQEAGESIRHVTKGQLWEVSLVTWGANPGATITEAHRRDADTTDAQLAAAEAQLLDAELHEAEAWLRRLEVEAQEAEHRRLARALGVGRRSRVRSWRQRSPFTNARSAASRWAHWGAT